MKRKRTCTNYFIIHGEKKTFKKEHQNTNANVRARPDVTFWAAGSPPPPRAPTNFSHILFKI